MVLQGSQRELVAAFARKLRSAAGVPRGSRSRCSNLPLVTFLFKCSGKDFSVAAVSTLDAVGFRREGPLGLRRRGRGRSLSPLWMCRNFRLPAALGRGISFRRLKLMPRWAEEGLVLAGSNCVKLREECHEARGTMRGPDRASSRHELGHYLLHRKVAMARVRDDNHPVYRDAEWQAGVPALRLGCQENAAMQCGMTTAGA